MIQAHPDGRRQRYTVNLDAPFLHPTLKGYTLRPFLSGLASAAAGPNEEVCRSGFLERTAAAANLRTPRLSRDQTAIASGGRRVA